VADKNNNNIPDEVEEVANKLGVGKIAGIIAIVTALGGSTAVMTKTTEIMDFACKGTVAEKIAPYKEALVCYRTAATLLEINDEDCRDILHGEHDE